MPGLLFSLWEDARLKGSYMEQYTQTLSHTQLFSGVSETEITSMMSCLNGNLRTYQKGDYVFHQGESIDNITVLAEGTLHIQRDDYWGNSNILSIVKAGEMFGEAYVTPNSGTILNNVIAVEKSVVMYFDVKKILTTCSSACRFHTMVVQNLFYAISDKNRSLVQKLGYMSSRSTRQKLISYLSDESAKQKSSSFTIPFNRQQLADFLSVDRSAMSSELCKMRDEGMLRFERNHFTLKVPDSV